MLQPSEYTNHLENIRLLLDLKELTIVFQTRVQTNPPDGIVTHWKTHATMHYTSRAMALEIFFDAIKEAEK